MRIEILSDFIGLKRVLKKGEVKCPPPGEFFPLWLLISETKKVSGDRKVKTPPLHALLQDLVCDNVLYHTSASALLWRHN